MVESGDVGRIGNGVEGGATDVGNESPAGIIGLAPEKAGVTREENAAAEAGRIIRQPIARAVAERGRSGRPLKTAPLPVGTDPGILERASPQIGRAYPGRVIRNPIDTEASPSQKARQLQKFTQEN